MAKTKQRAEKPTRRGLGSYHLEFLNPAQKLAWAAIDQHDICFLIGPAGTGKTQLATGFAISKLIAEECRKIVITRPVVEAEERLGFLPGTFEDKTFPYMLPIFDCVEVCVGVDGPKAEKVKRCLETAPLAYMRGRTLQNAVCVLDEAQNCTKGQLKLFMTRLGTNSKMIITGDPTQTDLPPGKSGLMSVVKMMEQVQGIGIVEMKTDSIVRHPLVSAILDKWEENG